MLKPTWLVPAVFLVLASTPNPGVIFEVELTDHGGETPRVQNIQIKVEGLNLTIPFQASEKSGQKGAMIFRGDRGEHGEMVVIMHDQRSYMVMDDSIIEQLGNTMSEVEKMMEEQIKSLPPEQQEAIRKAREMSIGLRLHLDNRLPRLVEPAQSCFKFPCFLAQILNLLIHHTDFAGSDIDLLYGLLCGLTDLAQLRDGGLGLLVDLSLLGSDVLRPVHYVRAQGPYFRYAVL